jgi:hypothetical protein
MAEPLIKTDVSNIMRENEYVSCINGYASNSYDQQMQTSYHKYKQVRASGSEYKYRAVSGTHGNSVPRRLMKNHAMEQRYKINQRNIREAKIARFAKIDEDNFFSCNESLIDYV